MKLIGTLLLVVILFSATCITAEPWINTSDLSLRSDIETLSDIGVIKAPISTYPLMWSGIIKDIEATDIGDVKAEYKKVYWRVKKLGKLALSNKPKRLLRASVGNAEQVFRSFGDSTRGKAELTASATSMNKSFAWNLQVNRVYDPLDGQKLHYDGSYVAAVLDNWIVTLGTVEKWWGASWDSANLLSNNARVPLTLSLDRNYSDASELPGLSWLGYWRVGAFTGQLDDPRTIKKPYLSGATFSFKPLEAIEASFRITAISGGISKSFIANIESKRLAGFDLRWKLPAQLISENLPTNFYWSVTDEGQQGNFSTQLFGLSSRFKLFEQDWRVFIESTDTASDQLNTTYEDGLYLTGYRYEQRAIGSTYDNDAKVVSLGLMGNLTRTQFLSVKLQNIKINQKDLSIGSNAFVGLDSLNTINNEEVNANRITAKWQYQADKSNFFTAELDYSDEAINNTGRQSENYRISFAWTYLL